MQKSEMLSALYSLRAGLTVISAEKERAQALGAKADEDLMRKRVELAQDPAWECRAKYAPDGAFRAYGESAALYRDANNEYERKESGWEFRCLSEEPLRADMKKEAKRLKNCTARIVLAVLLLIVSLVAVGLGVGFGSAKLLPLLAGKGLMDYLCLIFSGVCIVVGIVLGFIPIIRHPAVLRLILGLIFLIGAELCMFFFLNPIVKTLSERLMIYFCTMGAIAAIFFSFFGLKFIFQ